MRGVLHYIEADMAEAPERWLESELAELDALLGKHARFEEYLSNNPPPPYEAPHPSEQEATGDPA